MKRILFICTGNTCRSPMAEALLRHLAKHRNLQIEVRSAGVAAANGIPMSEHTRTILERKGIREMHHSKPLSPDWIDWADLVLTMTMHHKQSLAAQYPHAVDKLYALKEYVKQTPEQLEALNRFNAWEAELQMKLAMGQNVTEEDLEHLLALQNELGSYDVADPFGGSLNDYEQAAEEIEQALLQLLDKLERE
ncbi:low molecular weight protein arginine phosphatase [Marinicrinis lubricantis]|uniref:Low molecular weight protein arginine phosphatase n=1 Tax=Marinicrinis lubricantis TaxID=2086470 RepID=A0ABW1IK97_9BACL